MDTNSLGLRDDELGVKGPGEFRILVLGDSFTEGFGVEIEESYVEQLQAALNQGAPEGLRFEAVNAGVAGYGTLQAVAALKRLLEPVSPDLVLLGYYSENDVYDNLAFLGEYERDWPGALASALRERSRIFSRLEKVAKKAELAWDYPYGVRVTVAAFEDLIETCRARGIEVAFALFPPSPRRLVISYEMDDGLWSKLRRAVRWDPRFEHLQMGALARATGVPVYDTLELIEGLDDPASHFYPLNMHWKATLHRLVGLELSEFLLEEGLVPSASNAARAFRTSPAPATLDPAR